MQSVISVIDIKTKFHQNNECEQQQQQPTKTQTQTDKLTVLAGFIYVPEGFNMYVKVHL